MVFGAIKIEIVPRFGPLFSLGNLGNSYQRFVILSWCSLLKNWYSLARQTFTCQINDFRDYKNQIVMVMLNFTVSIQEILIEQVVNITVVLLLKFLNLGE